MDATTFDKLLSINREFYERFAAPFSGSRRTSQPGLQRVLMYLAGASSVLDAGCGNGRLAKALEANGTPMSYVGVDCSEPLLAIARDATAGLHYVHTQFVHADITRSGWVAGVPGSPFDAVTLLAVLHHIPGWDNRANLLGALRSVVASTGVVLVSTWQFLQEERLRRKIVPWSAVDLDDSLVEPGDYLIDWHRGGSGLRYCHMVDEQELAALAGAAGLSVTDFFYADGVRQNLNLFACLRPSLGNPGF